MGDRTTDCCWSFSGLLIAIALWAPDAMVVADNLDPFWEHGSRPELTLWHAYRGAERTTLEALLETYSAETDGVTVRARAIPYDGFNTKLEAAGPRGHGPDLFIAAHERLGELGAAGADSCQPRDAKRRLGDRGTGPVP